MRRRISWLVLATTSTVVVSFVIPLCLLVRNLAEERAMAAADQEARNAATVVAGLQGRPEEMAEVLSRLDQRGFPSTGVLAPDGTTIGAAEGMAADPEVQQVARTGAGVRVVDRAGGRVLVPVVVEDARGQVATAVVRSAVTVSDLRLGVARAWASIIGLGLALLLLALLMASRLGRRISQPLLAVAGVAHQLREGDLQARAVVTGTEETEELARALNGLAERTGELLVAERAAVGDLSHRLRTPVTALRLDAEAVTDPELAARLQEHIATLQATIDSIVAEARRPVRSALASSCDATAAVRGRVAFWTVLAEDQGRPMRVRLPEGSVPVPLAADDLTDLVDVLVDNVFAHTPDGTPFAVWLTVHGDRASLVVADEGPGVAAGRTPRPGSTGLGLDIVRRTAHACGGELLVGPALADGTGTRVEVSLPLVAA